VPLPIAGEVFRGTLDERFHDEIVAQGRARTSMKIAIQPDDYTAPTRPEGSDASSPRWAEAIVAAGHEVRWVDVHRADILEQVRGCDGFMWRWAHFGGMARIARRLLPVLEYQLGLCVYPDQKTAWHYEDKIAQSYLLEALAVPIPETWVFYDRQIATDWSEQAVYPLVIKLSTGAGSSNVQLVSNAGEARKWIDLMFDRWNTSLDPAASPLSLGKRFTASAQILATGNLPSGLRADHEPQRGYVFFQEFLPGNDFDTRITVIGNRAFGFRRMNREGDFRASGSGRLDYDRDAVDLDAVRLAYATTAALGAQSIAIDGLRRGDQWVVGEVSYTYMSDAIHDCPGHWELRGTPATGELVWVDGSIWPEQAQISDFLGRLEAGGNKREVRVEGGRG
jgi:glutathione synthase/RimK-type ligase-like ATP-grasp enzyme